MGWGVASQITCDMVCTCLVEVSFYYSLEGMAGLRGGVCVGGGGGAVPWSGQCWRRALTGN